jgi:hypothetical protein
VPERRTSNPGPPPAGRSPSEPAAPRAAERELARLTADPVGPTRLALRTAVTLGLVAGIALVARFPIAGAGETAALRLAIRTAAARVETCRPATPQELAAQPIHMRTEQICSEVMPDYRLRVSLDGNTVLDRRVAPHGIRRTRPLSVDAVLPVAPGAHALTVDLAPADPETLDDNARAQLPTARLDRTVELPAGRQLVVVLDPGGKLVVLDRAP